MTEALVYIGLVMVVVGVGYAAMYNCIDYSILLRRNSDDIANALHAGERWRADVRGASRQVALEGAGADQILRLAGNAHRIDYRFSGENVLRRLDSGPWVPVLAHVKASAMISDRRGDVAAWRWELELQPRAKGAIKPGRVRPLFTFLAAPGSAVQP